MKSINCLDGKRYAVNINGEKVYIIVADDGEKIVEFFSSEPVGWRYDNEKLSYMESLTRVSSVALQNGLELDLLVSQLEKGSRNERDFSSQIVKILIKHQESLKKMSKVEFRAWGKIPRISPFKVTITEKINGTNACIIIQDGEIVGTQSRNRLITPDDDNFGFATWVKENEAELKGLGDGYHYGEWAGPGIQKNPHGLECKTLYLFNTFRWNPNNPNRPRCCDTVPVLFDGELEPGTIQSLLEELKETADTDRTPEGVVVYYHAFRKYTKHTIISPNGKWCKD